MMGSGKSWFVGLLNLAAVLAFLKILSDLLAAWLAESQQKQLRATLERWHNALKDADPESLLRMPLSALSTAYERALGANPFSRLAFRRTCAFASLFLGASLGVAGLISGKPFGMNLPPWKSFMASCEYLRTFASQASARDLGDSFHIVQNASDLAALGNWKLAFLFTIYFALVVVFSTALLVSLSVAVSRLFLHEMIQARTNFRVFVLFLSNSLLLFAFGAGASLILFVLLNVWTWPFVPLLFGLSQLSLALGAGVTYAASMATWFFSAPWLRVVVILALLPSTLLAATASITFLVFPFRRRLQIAVESVLKAGLKSPRGIFPFISSTSAALAFCLGVLATISASLARLSLSLGAPKYFGIDPMIFSVGLILALLLWSIIRTSSGSRPTALLGTHDVLLLFLGTARIIVFGYYIQAILECLLTPGSAAVAARGSKPGVLAAEALAPAGVVAYFVVLSRAKSHGIPTTSLRIFFVLIAFDLLGAVRGLCSYRDFAWSFICDALGAPVCATIVTTAHSLLSKRQH